MLGDLIIHFFCLFRLVTLDPGRDSTGRFPAAIALARLRETVDVLQSTEGANVNFEVFDGVAGLSLFNIIG